MPDRPSWHHRMVVATQLLDPITNLSTNPMPSRGTSYSLKALGMHGTQCLGAGPTSQLQHDCSAGEATAKRQRFRLGSRHLAVCVSFSGKLSHCVCIPRIAPKRLDIHYGISCREFCSQTCFVCANMARFDGRRKTNMSPYTGNVTLVKRSSSTQSRVHIYISLYQMSRPTQCVSGLA